MFIVASARFNQTLLDKWAKTGEWPTEHEQCAPDFSCCLPEEARSDGERAAFMAASMEGRCRFLTHWFASALRTQLAKDGINREVMILDGEKT